MNAFNGRSMKPIIYSIYIILIDQVSKYLILNLIGFERSKNIIPNILNFTLVKNKGAAFSLFSNSTNILTLISILTSIIIIILLLLFPPSSFWNVTGLTFLLGGTVGNAIDRFSKGYVLDFFQLIPINFPIFNIADISINIAMICFIIDLIKTNDKSRIKY
tara:strand:+ start:86 stop:568 length:483 start_codon:yes stop_codon:yes gene_type:complete